ncbi:MAG: hypothetical protein NZ805_03430 [Armatimonadetes bacterium]|nr:hypothetical protein [Armatimonadota bacterium]MDW8029473.1 hypothetical protein [Armatimonadota bacterium]
MQNGRRRFIIIVALFVGAFVLTSMPISAAPFQAGQIFIAYGGSNIGVLADTVSLAGTPVQTLSISPSTFGTGTGLAGSGGIALDEFGNLYVTVQNYEGITNRRGIIKFDVSGNIVRKIDGGTTTDFRGISVQDGVIYVASGSGIRRFDATTGTAISPIIASGTSFRDVAFDRHGNLYALLSNQVIRWSAGSFSGSGTVLFSIPAQDPRAMVIDEDSNIYITFENTRVVRKYSLTGTLLATYSTPTGTGSLIGLDYDPGTQRLFASHTGTGIGQILWISKIAPSGTTMTAFGPNNLSGVRWLAVYPTPEPAVTVLLAAGFLVLKRRLKRR